MSLLAPGVDTSPGRENEKERARVPPALERPLRRCQKLGGVGAPGTLACVYVLSAAGDISACPNLRAEFSALWAEVSI